MKKCYMLFIIIGLILNPITFIATETNSKKGEENTLENPKGNGKNVVSEKPQWVQNTEKGAQFLARGIISVGRTALQATGGLASATGYAAYGAGKGLEYTGTAFNEIAKSDTLVLTICSAALLFGTYKICTTVYNDTGLKKLLDVPINILKWFKGGIDYILGGNNYQPFAPTPYNPESYKY